jgi:hypothetical protein
MHPALRIFGAAALLLATLSGCETKVTQISLVCRSGFDPVEPVRWVYTAKADPSLIKRIPVALDITLPYTGDRPRGVPPITTYFYRVDGTALRVASSAKATIPPKGSFTYHVDPGGYTRALTSAGRGGVDELKFVIQVDGHYFGGALSPAICGRWADRHIDVRPATELPDLRDKHPLNIAAGDWALVTILPAEVERLEGPEVSTYAFYPAPIVPTETTHEADVPEETAQQLKEVGVTATTPTYEVTGGPVPASNAAPETPKRG